MQPRAFEEDGAMACETATRLVAKEMYLVGRSLMIVISLQLPLSMLLLPLVVLGCARGELLHVMYPARGGSSYISFMVRTGPRYIRRAQQNGCVKDYFAFFFGSFHLFFSFFSFLFYFLCCASTSR